MSKENKGARQFNKVDRALEMQVIDWLQWSEFPENIMKRPDDSDMAQLALELIAKRKSAYRTLEQRLADAEKQLAIAVETLKRVETYFVCGGDPLLKIIITRCLKQIEEPNRG